MVFWLLLAWVFPVLGAVLGANQRFDLWADFQGETLVKTEGLFIVPWVKNQEIPFTNIREVEGAFATQGTHTHGIFYTYDLDVITSDGNRIAVLRGLQSGLRDPIPAEAKDLAAVLAEASNADVNLRFYVRNCHHARRENAESIAWDCHHR